MAQTLWFYRGKIWVSTIILVVLLTNVQCSFWSTPVPIVKANPPEIIGFTLDPTAPVLPGTSVDIQVNINRNGHRILEYRWFPDVNGFGSIINGNGTPTITYQTPQSPGFYKINVELKYEEANSVKGSVMVEVTPSGMLTVELTDAPTPESTKELTSEPTEKPTFEPTDTPTAEPTRESIYEPTEELTSNPTDTPTPEPTKEPTSEPTKESTSNPTDTPTPEPTKEPTSEPPRVPEAVVKVDKLNLRSGPGIEYPAKSSLSKGTTLNIIGRVDGNDRWIEVSSTELGLEGWVSALPDYVQIKGDFNSVRFVDAPPPPIPTPIPADALVNAPNGGELRSGPGDILPDGTNKYDLIEILPNGTPLNNLRPVIGNDDWVKVSAKLISGVEITGYIRAANIIRNVDLGLRPPIYEYGPHLLTPVRFETRSIEESIEFSWEPAGLPLIENQLYSLLLVRDGLPNSEACFHDQTINTKLSFKPEDHGCITGDYHWSVGIATKLGVDENGHPVWRDDSEFDERNPIGIGQPHSGGKLEVNDGGSGGGGTIISDPKK